MANGKETETVNEKLARRQSALRYAAVEVSDVRRRLEPRPVKELTPDETFTCVWKLMVAAERVLEALALSS